MTHRSALAAAFALPIGLAALVWGLATNVPVFDEWIWSPLVLRLFDGTLSASDLWAPQHVHRSLFPTAIALGLAHFDRWNTSIEALVGVALAIALQLVLFLFLRLRGASIGTFLVSSLLLFSLVQSDNCLWGFQFSWFLVNLCVVVVVTALAGPRPSTTARSGAHTLGMTKRGATLRMTLAAIAATVASYSLIFGFGAWVAGAIMLSGRRERRWLRLWVVLACVCIALFLYDYRLPEYEERWTDSFRAPQDTLAFLFAYLGTPAGLLGRLWTCIPMGVGLVVAFAAMARRARGDATVWVALFVFALTAGLLEAVGRSAQSIDAAVASRYVTTATLAWIALVGIAGSVLSPRVARIAGVCLAAVLLIEQPLGLASALVFSEIQQQARSDILQLDRIDDETLGEITNDPGFVRRQARALREKRLGPFSGP